MKTESAAAAHLTKPDASASCVPAAGLVEALTGMPDGEVLQATQALIESRQNVSPRRLAAPGPTAQQLHSLLGLAAAAPDHGLLTPWRFMFPAHGATAWPRRSRRR